MLKKLYKIIVVVMINLLCMNSYIFAADTQQSKLKVEEPFDVQVEKVEMVQETETSLMEENSEVAVKNINYYLSICVTIENKTKNDFQNVSFKLILNKEVSPFIASHILEYDSEKMNVTSEKKAEASVLEKSDELLIYGFSHTWDMLLTTEGDLREYYDNLSVEEISDYLQSIQVDISWDGGSQSKTIDLSLRNQNEEPESTGRK